MTTRGTVSIVLIALIFVSCTTGTSKVPNKVATPAQHARVEIEKGALLIDVRSQEEFSEGHVPGAINIPYDQVEKRLSEINRSKDDHIVVYCKSGRRAGMAREILLQNGFKEVVNAGGYSDLMASRQAVE